MNSAVLSLNDFDYFSLYRFAVTKETKLACLCVWSGSPENAQGLRIASVEQGLGSSLCCK